jgi:biopolymer transport protein ExbD
VNLKSKLIVRLSLLTVIGALSFNTLLPAINASAATTKLSTEISSSAKPQVDAKETRATIEKYLVLNSDGTISLSKDIPASYYKKYQLDKLEKHLAEINKKVANKEVSVNSDFSIRNTGNTNGVMMADGGEDYEEDYWWGYSVGFSYNSAIQQINDLNYAAEVGVGENWDMTYNVYSQ